MQDQTLPMVMEGRDRQRRTVEGASEMADVGGVTLVLGVDQGV